MGRKPNDGSRPTLHSKILNLKFNSTFYTLKSKILLLMIEIILAVIALVGNAGWVATRSQLRKSRAEAEREELDLSASYVEKFHQNIYLPLERICRNCASALRRLMFVRTGLTARWLGSFF